MKSVKEIYNNLGDNIVNNINDSWEKAALDFKVLKDFSSYKGYYISNNEKKNISVSKFSLDVDQDLIDLHKITTEGGINRWNRGFFVTFPDGRFEIEFIWDQKLEDELNSLEDEA